jgi:hypothetical protein
MIYTITQQRDFTHTENSGKHELGTYDIYRSIGIANGNLQQCKHIAVTSIYYTIAIGSCVRTNNLVTRLC